MPHDYDRRIAHEDEEEAPDGYVVMARLGGPASMHEAPEKAAEKFRSQNSKWSPNQTHYWAEPYRPYKHGR
jgi:hypothetical protein